MGATISQQQLARAEAAVAALAEEYLAWAARDLAKMRAVADGMAVQADVDRLYALCHDVKGQGGSFGYPLVSAIANSLCRLLKHLQLPDDRAPAAIDAHLDAIAQVLEKRLAGPPTDGSLMLGLSRLADLFAVV